MAHPTALLLNVEIAAVVTSMRQNAKWALVPMRYTVRASLMTCDKRAPAEAGAMSEAAALDPQIFAAA